MNKRVFHNADAFTDTLAIQCAAESALLKSLTPVLEDIEIQSFSLSAVAVIKSLRETVFGNTIDQPGSDPQARSDKIATDHDRMTRHYLADVLRSMVLETDILTGLYTTFRQGHTLHRKQPLPENAALRILFGEALYNDAALENVRLKAVGKLTATTNFLHFCQKIGITIDDAVYDAYIQTQQKLRSALNAGGEDAQTSTDDIEDAAYRGCIKLSRIYAKSSSAALQQLVAEIAFKGTILQEEWTADRSPAEIAQDILLQADMTQDLVKRCDDLLGKLKCYIAMKCRPATPLN